MGGAVGAEQARFRQGPGITPVGLDRPRPGRIHGATFGSATMASWPRASRHRAAHSLSVEASITIRPRGRDPSTASKRSGSVTAGRASSRAACHAMRFFTLQHTEPQRPPR